MSTRVQMNNGSSNQKSYNQSDPDIGLNSLKKRSFSFDTGAKTVYDTNRDTFYENLLFPSSNSSANHSTIIDVEKLKSNAWKGIPFIYRPHVWRIFLDYEPANTSLSASVLQHKRNDYFDCLDRVFNESQRHLWTNSQKQTETQILKDLPRTHVLLIRNEERVKLLFERVLFVWAVRHPASGYVQGMNDLLQPFFFVFLSEKLLNNQNSEGNSENNDQIFDDIESIENLASIDGLSPQDLNDIEADCFWCFSKLLDSIQDLFTKDQPGIYKMLNHLEIVVSRVAPQLAKTIKDEEIQYQEFAFRWMNCLLIREFPMKLVLRLWDNYVCDPQKIATMHVYICAAMMEILLQPRLKGLSHADFVIRIQDPFMHQVSTGSFSSSASGSAKASPQSSGNIVNSLSSSELEPPPTRRIKRAQSTVIHPSGSSSNLNLSPKMKKKKDGWDEQDIDMVIAQAYVYEKMFQSSTHLKSPSKPKF